jgi:hypothetical protein
MNGVVLCATAIALPLGLKATPSAFPVGSVAGLAYLVPNPETDHGYANTYGEKVCATAITSPPTTAVLPAAAIIRCVPIDIFYLLNPITAAAAMINLRFDL